LNQGIKILQKGLEILPKNLEIPRKGPEILQKGLIQPLIVVKIVRTTHAFMGVIGGIAQTTLLASVTKPSRLMNVKEC